MTLFARLRLACKLLRARRAVVLIPDFPTLNMAVVGTVPPAAWEAIVHFAMREHALAVEEAHARLLAAIEESRREEAALDAERAQVAAGTRTTRESAALLALAQRLIQPKAKP